MRFDVVLALLVSTTWAMPEPLLRGTSDRTGSTFLVCIYQHLLIIAILEPMGIFLIRLIMKKNEKNDELQSRREFFKKAAKGVLPILGLCILPSSASAMLHNVTKEMSPKDCNNNCSYNCTYGCKTSCNISCSGGCYHLCKGSCEVSCANDCNTACVNYCDNTCRGGCYLTCRGTCSGSCNGYCSYGCAGTMALF